MEGFIDYAEAAARRILARPGAELRHHLKLHAKVVVIDEAIAYVGSANWYRYSLEKGPELVLRGPVTEIAAVLDEVEGLWQQGLAVSGRTQAIASSETRAGFGQEVIDPIARKVLAEVRGAFVLGQAKNRKKH